MFDILFGLILLGLGIHSLVRPIYQGNFLEADTHQEFRETLRKEQENFQAELKQREVLRETKLAELKKTFQQNLNGFNNSTKKQKISTIQDHFEDLNVQLVNRASSTIIKISELLDIIIQKAADEKKNGKDTASVDAAIVETQAAIKGAQTVIADQAVKTYVIPVTNEASVKEDALTLKKTFMNDVNTMQETVFASRKALNTLIRELAKVRGEPLPDMIRK